MSNRVCKWCEGVGCSVCGEEDFNIDHTFWYEQDVYGNKYRIDYWTTSTSGDQHWKKSKEFSDTLVWIASLPETKK